MKTKKIFPLRLLKLAVVICSGVLLGSAALAAGKLDFSFGGYAITASTTQGSGSVSNLGAYVGTYSYGVGTHWDVFLGFTVVMSDVVGGDMGFGFDLGANYFPFTGDGTTTWTADGTTVERNELWRPFIGLQFSQRQFEVVQASTYAGAGLGLGVERSLSRTTYLKVEGRYVLLTGPSSSKSNDFDATLGYGFSF